MIFFFFFPEGIPWQAKGAHGPPRSLEGHHLPLLVRRIPSTLLLDPVYVTQTGPRHTIGLISTKLKN